MIQLVIGLGNPGREYAGTRHNLGFAVLDEVVREQKLTWSASPKFKAECATWTTDTGDSVFLAKPLTFMNLSGQSVQAIAAYHKVQPKDILVVCDDSNLPLGEIRIRRQGSPGGHNGLDSVAEHLQSTDFPRIRLGIGQSTPPPDLSAFVLGRFAPEEKEEIDHLTRRAVLAIRATLFFPLEQAMNEFNGRPTDP